MIRLTNIGFLALTQFINKYGNDVVIKHYNRCRSTEAWLNDIDDDGHLEMASRYSKDGQPHTIHFTGDQVEDQQ